MKKGDRVVLLDGAKLGATFYGGWNPATMERFVGKTVTLWNPSVAHDSNGKPLGFYFTDNHGCPQILWDVRMMKPAGRPTVVIYGDKEDPQKVWAKNTETGKKEFAKCHPGDTFDYKTGAILACERLLTEEKPKPELWSGIVICTDGFPGLTTTGRLYHVKNGVLRFDSGELTPAHEDATSFEAFAQYFTSRFIEYKGETML